MVEYVACDWRIAVIGNRSYKNDGSNIHGSARPKRQFGEIGCLNIFDAGFIGEGDLAGHDLFFGGIDAVAQ